VSALVMDHSDCHISAAVAHAHSSVANQILTDLIGEVLKIIGGLLDAILAFWRPHVPLDIQKLVARHSFAFLNAISIDTTKSMHANNLNRRVRAERVQEFRDRPPPGLW
jgi:hypothetical protein